MTELKPAFRKMAGENLDNLVLKPLLHNYIHLGKYPDKFSVTFEKHGKERRPDGFFHPSTHPLWTERQLILYLSHPEQMLVEPLEFGGGMSVTVGTAMHDFIEVCMIDAGILEAPRGTCVNCQREHGRRKGQCPEWGAYDLRTLSRGHMDGIYNVGERRGGFDLKTSNNMKLQKCSDLDLEQFKEKWPQYWAQGQEYMRLTGLREFIFLFLGMGFPWTMVEYQVPYDVEWNYQIETKYLSVIDHVQKGTLNAIPCCAPRSATARQCLARNACPIGLM